MKQDFTLISDAFISAGIDNKNVEFTITEYSLNSRLSFKFINIEELLLFLDVTAPSKKEMDIRSKFLENGIDPDKYFYVNFFRPKVAEL
ncbi:hypothetical protein ACX0HA_12990 [Flavobacterium hauense]